MQIFLPALEEQQKIVEELDNYQKVIDGAKQVIENYKPAIEIKAEWPVKSLKELITILQFKKGRTPKYGDSSIAVIKSGQARGSDTIDLTKLSYLDSGASPFLLQKGDIMINTTGVGTVGRITYFALDGVFVTDSHISILRMTDESLYLSRYMFLVLNSLYTRKYLESLATGSSGQVELSKDAVLRSC